MCYALPTFSLFVCFNLVYRRVLVCSSEARTLVYDKHTSKCQSNIYLLKLRVNVPLIMDIIANSLDFLASLNDLYNKNVEVAKYNI